MIHGRVTPHSEGPNQAVNLTNMTALKIKTGRLFLALGLGLSMAAMVTGCATGPFSSNLGHSPTDIQPTWSGDDHAMPVYTSPAVTPATTNLQSADTPPD